MKIIYRRFIDVVNKYIFIQSCVTTCRERIFFEYFMCFFFFLTATYVYKYINPIETRETIIHGFGCMRLYFSNAAAAINSCTRMGVK